MPAKSEKQRKFMGAELARKRAGKATQTEMTEDQLEDFASKQLQKITIGAQQEGQKPKLPDHLLDRKKGHGSEYPPTHSGALGPHRELTVQKLQGILNKEDGGGDGGGALAGGGTVFTSTNAGVFSPTHGERDVKSKKKKTGIERLGQFITDNSPEKKMIKSPVVSLTNLVNEVTLGLRKEDEKRQTPFHSNPTLNDPPQIVERGNDNKKKRSLPEDPDLVYQQNMTEKEQKRIMNEDKNKDGTDPHTLLMAWASGGTDVDELHQGGKKDDLESDEDRNKPEKKKLLKLLEDD
tara:strand:+ start:563 stop:1441 length:879 start_codon:yes stop_codon:yes gene_type:complete